jgi:hypothetical protein
MSDMSDTPASESAPLTIVIRSKGAGEVVDAANGVAIRAVADAQKLLDSPAMKAAAAHFAEIAESMKPIQEQLGAQIKDALASWGKAAAKTDWAGLSELSRAVHDSIDWEGVAGVADATRKALGPIGFEGALPKWQVPDRDYSPYVLPPPMSPSRDSDRIRALEAEVRELQAFVRDQAESNRETRRYIVETRHIAGRVADLLDPDSAASPPDPS